MPFVMELAFTTQTLIEDFERAIEAGAVEVQPIQAKPWGQESATCEPPVAF